MLIHNQGSLRSTLFHKVIFNLLSVLAARGYMVEDCSRPPTHRDFSCPILSKTSCEKEAFPIDYGHSKLHDNGKTRCSSPSLSKILWKLEKALESVLSFGMEVFQRWSIDLTLTLDRASYNVGSQHVIKNWNNWVLFVYIFPLHMQV